MPILKNWAFVSLKPSPYALTGKGVVKTHALDIKDFDNGLDEEVCLFGQTHQDHRYNPETTEFQDGHRIKTTPCVSIDFKKGHIVTESGSIYQLEGPPHTEYSQFTEREF